MDRQERIARRRAALRLVRGLLIRALAAAAVVAGLPWGVIALHGWATTSPLFAITEITISGLDHTQERDLLARLGIAPGDNVFSLDVDAAAQRLTSLPWVHEARVQTRFPQGVIVEVLEREARALVDLGHLYLVDERGAVFKRAMPHDPLDLPVITGLPRDEWLEGGGARERLVIAMEELELVQRHGIVRELPLQELQIDEGEGLTLFLGERGMKVTVGHGDLQRKLDRLALVLGEAERRGKRVEAVRLDNRTRPEWIAARLAGSGGGRRAAPEG